MASQMLDDAHRRIGRGLAAVLIGSLVAAGCGSSAGSEGDAQATASSAPGPSSTEAEAPSAPSTTAIPGTTVVETTAAVEPAATESDLACEPITDGRDYVEIISSWEPGAVRELELTKSIEATAGSGTTSSSVTPIRLEILEETADEQSFQWTQGATTVYQDGVRVPPVALGPSGTIMEGSEVRYSVDAWTGLLDVDNVDELRERLFDSMTSLGGLDPQAAAVVDQAMAKFEAMDDEQLSLLLTAEVQLYHYFDYGWFDDGEVIEAPDELPNAFGGENFPATTTLTVTSFADEDGCVAIESVTQPEPVEMQRILTEFLSGAGGDPGELDGMELENRVVVQFDAVRGFVHSVVATQTITFAGESRIETNALVDVTQ